MRVVVIPDPYPFDPTSFVARIRLLEPLAALSRAYPDSFSYQIANKNTGAADADILLIQRTPYRDFDALSQGIDLLQKANSNGASIVWELDDHIFCPDIRELIEYSKVDEIDEKAIALCDGHKPILSLAQFFFCPNQQLAEAIHRIKPDAKVFILPNALDFDRPRWSLQQQLKSRTTTVIGWAGGSRVGTDLEILAPALDRVMRHNDLCFVLAGSLKYAKLFQHLPVGRIELVPWVDYDHYPQLLERFDIALIPMQDHAYNRCKSPLKVIDFGAVGVPAICSPTLPFLTLADEVAHFAVTTDDWVRSIELELQQVEDQRARARRRKRIRDRFHVRRSLDRFWAILQEIAASGATS